MRDQPKRFAARNCDDEQEVQKEARQEGGFWCTASSAWRMGYRTYVAYGVGANESKTALISSGLVEATRIVT